MPPKPPRLKIKITQNLPTKWPGGRGLLLQGNIPVNSGRLRAKLLIFRDNCSMRRYWFRVLGHSDLGRFTLGPSMG